MSALYEDKIMNMGNAGRNGGNITRRPLIKTIVKVVAPKVGETIYDGAVGSAGFLCESFEYMKDPKHNKLTTRDMETLQKRTFFGKEKKSLAYIIGIMNMILHGIEAPNILHQHAGGEHHQHSGERSVSGGAGEPALRRQGTPGGAAKLPHQNGRDGVFVLAALHQDSASGRTWRRGHQEYVPLETDNASICVTIA
jgi:hypothetical protein